MFTPTFNSTDYSPLCTENSKVSQDKVLSASYVPIHLEQCVSTASQQFQSFRQHFPNS